MESFRWLAENSKSRTTMLLRPGCHGCPEWGASPCATQVNHRGVWGSGLTIVGGALKTPFGFHDHPFTVCLLSHLLLVPGVKGKSGRPCWFHSHLGNTPITCQECAGFTFSFFCGESFHIHSRICWGVVEQTSGAVDTLHIGRTAFEPEEREATWDGRNHTVDSRSPFRTTLKPRETIIHWHLRFTGASSSRGFRPSTVWRMQRTRACWTSRFRTVEHPCVEPTTSLYSFETILGLPRTRKTRVLLDFDLGSKWKFGQRPAFPGSWKVKE